MELSEILTTMKGESITNNWDVVCAMSAARLTQLFEEKYNNGFLVHDVEHRVDVFGVAFVEVDLKIRHPLVSFIPGSPDKIRLTMRIKEGVSQVVDINGNPNEDYQQKFLPQDRIEDEPYIDAIVPLQGLRGEVDNEEVIINFDDEEASWRVDVNMDPLLKDFTQTAIKGYFRENVAGRDYSLGTLIYKDNPDLIDLTPTSFRFAATAEKTGDGTESIGSLLLFINVKGGRDLGGRPLSLNKIVNPVPNGFSTALIISSRVLMSVAIYPSFSKLGPVEKVMPIHEYEENKGQENIFGLWKLRCIGGTRRLGKPGTDFGQGVDLRGIRFPEDVEVSLSGLHLEVDGDKGINSTHPKTTQTYPFQRQYTHGGGSIPYWKTYHVDIHFESNGKYNSSILESEDQQGVVFNDKNINATVTYSNDTSGWWNGPQGKRIAEAIDKQFKEDYENLILFDMKGISTFAVSNLLFPEDRVIEFGKKDDGTNDQGVYIPGDMLIVGRVKRLNG